MKKKFSPNICQAKSHVISNLRDEEKKFSVQTYIKPNLVLSQIQETKREVERERDEEMEKNFAQIWCYLKI